MTMRVAAAVIFNDKEEILICKRGPGGSCAFLWEFPGGKIESGESAQKCLRRECLEELEVTIKLIELFHESSYAYPEVTIDFSFFTAQILSGQPKPLVHQEIRWARVQELGDFEFCPGDQPVLALLAERAPKDE
jgi:8-oxo-dGTP diphosphatase